MHGFDHGPTIDPIDDGGYPVFRRLFKQNRRGDAIVIGSIWLQHNTNGRKPRLEVSDIKYQQPSAPASILTPPSTQAVCRPEAPPGTFVGGTTGTGVIQTVTSDSDRLCVRLAENILFLVDFLI